ncbi:peptidyl-prolyl cis-trans isomerase [Thiocystis violacea]|uniref:peptidylprolyl isomerase n=1 Tax=Thiocystis violacea TaxID=13725 RepID=UPI0019042525|nr:peptidylprolyl isomerase [Thiocystis violacea]MBK1716365.1 hypothetical protein [Thiocystis violacea]
MRWGWLRHPVAHFTLIGIALYGASLLLTPSEPERPTVEREPILVSAERRQALQADFARRWGAWPTPEQTSALIARTIDDELLYREARVLALDFEDGSVRRRLVEKMSALSDRPGRDPDELVREALALGLDDDIVIRRLLIEKMRLVLAHDPMAPPPSETDLLDYLDRHRDRFESPAELTFSHLFFSASARGADLGPDALEALARVRSMSPSASAALVSSDPFLLGSRMRAYSQGRLTARFGKSFAEQVFALPLGAWSNPIASPYGRHLVWVEEKSAPRPPELASVRRTVTEGVLKEQAAARLARGMERLRKRYEIRIDEPDDLSRPAATLASRPR